jgi:hypothetical protein
MKMAEARAVAEKWMLTSGLAAWMEDGGYTRVDSLAKLLDGARRAGIVEAAGILVEAATKGIVGS